jgi:hypothetical protein
MARRLGPSHMRVLGALGGVVACAGAGVAVAANPKPGDAPLNPPVAASAVAPNSATPAPACDAGEDPAIAAAVGEIRAASGAAERRAVLRGLTADQRQQVTALLRGSGGATPASGPCGAAAPAQPMPTIQPDVVAAGPTAAPVTNSYVS